MKNNQRPWMCVPLLRSFALTAVLGLASTGLAQQIDVTPQHLPWIPPGNVVEKDRAPKGFSHVVYVSYSRVGAGDVDQVSDMVRRIAQLLSLAVAANVKSNASVDKPVYSLDKVALGIGTKIRGRNVIISSDTQAELGANLGMIDSMVLKQCESDIKEGAVQVARTPTMAVFDTTVQLLVSGEHRKLINRYAILVSSDSGQLGTLCWLMNTTSADRYQVVNRPLQFLPPGMEIDQVLNVKADKFWLGIPASDAFGQVKPPEGTPVDWTDSLRPLASLKRFTAAEAQQLETELWKLWGK